MLINPAQREGDIGASNFTNPLVIISVYPKTEGTRSREPSPTRTAHNAKSVGDKQPLRRGSPVKSNIEKKPPKKTDKSQTKPEVTATTALKTVKSPTRTVLKPQKAKSERNDNNVSKNERIRPRSRSSSPTTSPTRQKIDLQNKAKMKKEVNRISSPVRHANSQFGKGTQQKVTMMQQAETSSSKQMKMIRQKDTTKDLKKQSDGSDESVQELTDALKSSKGVNTDVTLSKKAMVESFKQAYMVDGQLSWDGHANRKRQSEWAEANTDASNLAVSIDGENEFYDGLFRNGERATDVQVRNVHVQTESLKNLLYSTDKGTSRKRSDPYAHNKSNVSLFYID